MSKKDELLKVLDMSEDEQLKFLNSYPDKTIDGQKILIEGEWRLTKESLADLSFRLRDEVGRQDFAKGVMVVYLYKTNHKNRLAEFLKKHTAGMVAWWECQEWMLYQPAIYMVNAALIAKQLAKENTDSKD